MPDRNVMLMKSYVWHFDRCFFVSTINRESSSMYGGAYAETLVWTFDWNKREQGDLIHSGSDFTDSVRQHMAICNRLITTGNPEPKDED